MRRITTKVYYIVALDGETTNLNEFTNFCGVLLLIQQFVNSIKFVVLSPLRYESGRAERPRLSVIIIFVVSLIRLTDKLQFTEKINNRARVDFSDSLSIDTAKPRIRP